MSGQLLSPTHRLDIAAEPPNGLVHSAPSTDENELRDGPINLLSKDFSDWARSNAPELNLDPFAYVL